MAREIRITIDDRGRIDVWEGDRHTEQLAWGEMLDHIARLTITPSMAGVGYPMRTDAEWKDLYSSMRAPKVGPGIFPYCNRSPKCRFRDPCTCRYPDDQIPF